MFPRTLEIILRKTKKSVLLLGPRQTGKSTLLKSMAPDLTIDFAHEPTFLEFARDPTRLDQFLAAQKPRLIFIDEVQRLPSLLNTVQHWIDRDKNLKFLLSGSSARKLKRGKANLLPGRIHAFRLGPLTPTEIGKHFDLKHALSTGMLPGIYSETDQQERIRTLSTYATTYLKEEIQAEALTRDIEGFARFLFVAAACSGTFLDLAKLAQEALIVRMTAMRYFEILEDTLVASRCPPFAVSERRRLVQHPKFYIFDPGVLNALLSNFTVSDDRKGLLFEHFFFATLEHSFRHAEIPVRISTYRTSQGAEVDFIVQRDGKTWAVELKASRDVGKNDLRGLKSFADFYRKPHVRCVAYWGTAERVLDGVKILPWEKVYHELLGK